MTSTAFSLLFHSLAALGFIGVILLFFYMRNKYLRDFPGRSTIERLRGEVSELAGLQADLTDRFSRFQRREGMRDARSAKEREQEVMAEAQRILAQEGSQEPSGDDKTALYRRARRVQ